MKVVISAGGTGGHIYPALSIINKIKEMEPNSEFLYIGTHDRMEKDIVPKYGIPFKSIKVYGFEKNILRDFRVIKYFIKGVKETKKMIKEFNPDIVIGVGGYVTGPVLYAAHHLGYKTFIHEQNSVPGKANIFLSKFVDKIGVSFASTKDCFPKGKTIVTGNPCSENALSQKPCDKKEFGLDENKKLVLFVMGSLGASRVNKVLVDTMPKFSGKNYEAIFITGNDDYEEISKKKFPSNVHVYPYIEGLAKLMKKTDVIVSRAGASTLSEIMSLNIPSILIPSPYVPNNHQYKNAMDLVNNKAALIIEEKDLNSEVLMNKLDTLINDKNKQEVMKQNLSKMAINNSSTIIYTTLKELVDRK